MKRFILFCLVLFSVNANAQVFAGSGSTWWYYTNNTEYEGLFKYTLTGTDSTGKIKYVHLGGRVFPHNPDYLPWTPSSNYKLYVSNDTVYSMWGNTKYLEYNFDANIGDFIPRYLINCNNILEYSYLYVEDKYDTLLYGQILRVLKVRQHNCGVSNLWNQRLIIEKIGTMNAKFLPGGSQMNLICYSSNELSFSLNGLSDCDSAAYILSDNTFETDFLNVFPNPTDGLINFKGLKNGSYSYSLYNSVGQLITTQMATTNTIDLSDRQPGLYFVSLTLTNGYSQTVKVVKE